MAGRNSHRIQYNDHHLNWEKRQWRMFGFARRIREHPGMIVHGLYIPTHNRLHQEIPPIAPPSALLGGISLTHLMSIDVDDGRDGAILQADYLWKIAQQDTELGDEAYKYAQHLDWQIEFLGLGKEAA
jgi:hypothetical protein